MPDQITCLKCGSVDDYRTEQKSNNLCAYCNSCGAFIKNIPYAEPMLYVGKYKGVPISEIDDRRYLDWAWQTLALSSATINAIQSQIRKLDSK